MLFIQNTLNLNCIVSKQHLTLITENKLLVILKERKKEIKQAINKEPHEVAFQPAMLMPILARMIEVLTQLVSPYLTITKNVYEVCEEPGFCITNSGGFGGGAGREGRAVHSGKSGVFTKSNI